MIAYMYTAFLNNNSKSKSNSNSDSSNNSNNNIYKIPLVAFLIIPNNQMSANDPNK